MTQRRHTRSLSLSSLTSQKNKKVKKVTHKIFSSSFFLFIPPVLYNKHKTHVRNLIHRKAEQWINKHWILSLTHFASRLYQVDIKNFIGNSTIVIRLKTPWMRPAKKKWKKREKKNEKNFNPKVWDSWVDYHSSSASFLLPLSRTNSLLLFLSLFLLLLLFPLFVCCRFFCECQATQKHFEIF